MMVMERVKVTDTEMLTEVVKVTETEDREKHWRDMLLLAYPCSRVLL